MTTYKKRSDKNECDRVNFNIGTREISLLRQQTNLEILLDRIFGFIGNLTMMITVACIVIVIPSYLVEYFFINSLISHELVKDSQEYWYNILIVMGAILVPPLAMFSYQALPNEEQESVKAVGFGVSVFSEWLGIALCVFLAIYGFLSL